MYRELSRLDGRSEEDFSLEFEEPAFLTLGLCYEARPRFSGGAYHPLLRRSDHFRKEPLGRALEHRQQLAQRLLAIDDIVNDKVKRLKDRGLMSPYLKSFVMARVNPLRFKPRGSSVPPLPDVLTQVGEALKKFDPERIKPEHLARASGPIDTTE
jgi:ParB family transcriptional regulator, chromosome partitioning protein